MPDEVIYECPKCGYKGPRSSWEMFHLRCPICFCRVAKKVRPPTAKRILAR